MLIETHDYRMSRAWRSGEYFFIALADRADEKEQEKEVCLYGYCE